MDREKRQENMQRGIKKQREKKDYKRVKNRQIAQKIFDKSKQDLIPNMQKKVKEVSEKIEELMKEEGGGLLSTQIELIIGGRTLCDVASINAHKNFTPDELIIGLELYRQVIAEVNKYTVYPPSVFSFCSFMNMSSVTYNAYKVDPDRAEAIRMIDDYIAGIQFSSAQLGKLKEVITIFGLKSMHGLYEAQAPIVVEKKHTIDIDEIQSQLKALNSKKVIEVDSYTDKD